MRWTQFPLSNLKHLLHLHSRPYIDSSFYLHSMIWEEVFFFFFLRQGFEKGKELEALRNIFLPFFPYSAQMRFDHVYLEGYEPEVEKNFFFLIENLGQSRSLSGFLWCCEMCIREEASILITSGWHEHCSARSIRKQDSWHDNWSLLHKIHEQLQPLIWKRFAFNDSKSIKC